MNLLGSFKEFLLGFESKSRFKINPFKPNNWTEAEIKDFTFKLRQTIIWTERLSNDFDFESGFYGTVFRQTNPSINGKLLYNFDSDYATWNIEYNYKNYESLLKTALNLRPYEEIDLSQLMHLGRILTFETCISTEDGAPIIESKCFVDEGDVPPIDTWFFLKNNYYHSYTNCPQVLFCWIPKKFESVMQKAINVEIFDSYRWLDTSEPLLIEKITKGA